MTENEVIEFEKMNIGDQKQYLFNKVEKHLELVTLNTNSINDSIPNKSKLLKTTIKDLIQEIIEVMQIMQKHPILVKGERNRKENINSILYTFNYDDILISISYDKRINSVLLIESLLKFIEKRFMINKENNTYKIK